MKPTRACSNGISARLRSTIYVSHESDMVSRLSVCAIAWSPCTQLRRTFRGSVVSWRCRRSSGPGSIRVKWQTKPSENRTTQLSTHLAGMTGRQLLLWWAVTSLVLELCAGGRLTGGVCTLSCCSGQPSSAEAEVLTCDCPQLDTVSTSQFSVL